MLSPNFPISVNSNIGLLISLFLLTEASNTMSDQNCPNIVLVIAILQNSCYETTEIIEYMDIIHSLHIRMKFL